MECVRRSGSVLAAPTGRAHHGRLRRDGGAAVDGNRAARSTRRSLAGESITLGSVRRRSTRVPASALRHSNFTATSLPH